MFDDANEILANRRLYGALAVPMCVGVCEENMPSIDEGTFSLSHDARNGLFFFPSCRISPFDSRMRMVGVKNTLYFGCRIEAIIEAIKSPTTNPPPFPRVDNGKL